MHVWPGWYDASAIVAPSDWRIGSFGADGLGGVATVRFGPFAQVALGRYREVGSNNWRHFDLSAMTRQSAPSFGYPALMSALEPMTTYEVQGAWIWALGDQHLYLSEWTRWFEAWQDWLSPEAARWSESQRFQTGGPVCPRTEVVGNSVTVLYPSTATPASETRIIADGCTSRQLGVLTWLTSPSWPGVIWAYGASSLRPSYGMDPEAARAFVARYAGLPENTDYVLGIQQPLPHSFRQAPQQSVNVRTLSRPIHVTAPGVDPRDIEIRIGGDRIIVEWTNQEPYLDGSADLFLRGTTTRVRHSDWRQDATRTVTVYRHLGSQTAFILHVSLRAIKPLGDGSGFSNMCMIREIVIPPGGPDAYLDRFFFASSNNQPPTIIPGDTPEVFVEYLYGYHRAGRCNLASYAYP